MRRLAVTTIMFLLALPAAAANAGFFPSVPVDGPADITEAGDITMAPDGTGAIGYAKREGGVVHAYVGRFVSGQFVALDRVDPGLESGSSQVVVGAANGGRISVFFVHGGNLYANVRPNAAAAWTGPQFIASNADNPSAGMSVHGVGFAAFRSNGNVYSAWMARGTNTYGVNATPLDIDESKPAGGGTGRPKIAVSAAGSAVVVWGEEGTDALNNVYMRRVFQGSISVAPQEASMPNYDGRNGLEADYPDVDIEDDASYAWVAFRQKFNDGGTPRTRMLTRQLKGATFEYPYGVDYVGWGEGVGEPRMEMNTRGEGMATVTTAIGGAAIFSTLKDQIFRQGLVLGGGSPIPKAASVTSYGYDRVIAYTEGYAVKGRFFDDSNRKRTLPFPSAAYGLTTSTYGIVAGDRGFDLAGDSAGNALVLFTQGDPGAQRVVVAGYDLPPVKPTALSKWTKSRKKPKFTWKSEGDAWGPVTYRVELAGKVVGTTTGLTFSFKKKLKYAKKYKFRITAVDVRGQITRSSTVNFAVDSKAPSADVTFKRTGKKVSVKADVADKGTKKRPASGIASVVINWGDGKTKNGTSGSHSFKSGGKKKVRVTVTDKAGNRKTVAKRI